MLDEPGVQELYMEQLNDCFVTLTNVYNASVHYRRKDKKVSLAAQGSQEAKTKHLQELTAHDNAKVRTQKGQQSEHLKLYASIYDREIWEDEDDLFSLSKERR